MITNKDMLNQEFYTVSELALMIGAPVNTIYTAMRGGRLKRADVFGVAQVHKEEVARFLTKNEISIVDANNRLDVFKGKYKRHDAPTGEVKNGHRAPLRSLRAIAKVSLAEYVQSIAEAERDDALLELIEEAL